MSEDLGARWVLVAWLLEQVRQGPLVARRRTAELAAASSGERR
ncbi:MAG TPA: hypothetical protein VHG32_22895 [Thermoanaerobaculia bacterium]|jgi:hypothetical protein|nr:hypothetical protein [Thermoanaerobaculia bacterium]